MPCGFVMLVGPGEAAIALHTLRAARDAHPDAPVWLYDDATLDGTGDELWQWASQAGNVQVLRSSISGGYRGVTRSLFRLLASVNASEQATRLHSLIKLDPDALVIGEGLANAADRVFEVDGPGILGAFRHGPELPRDHSRQRRNLAIDSLMAGPAKTGGKLRLGRPYWLPWLQAANRLGYQRGVSVQGGVFAISTITLRHLSATGFLRVPSTYRAMTYEEDILLSVGVAGIGHHLHEYAHTGLSWWVQHKSPVRLSPQEAADRRLDVVHPLKNDDHSWQIRESLTAKRRGQDR